MAKTKKLSATRTPRPPIKQVPLAKLLPLLGRQVDDPEVTEIVERSGDVKVDAEYIVAKDAGFDFALEKVEGRKKKVLETLFVFGPPGPETKPKYKRIAFADPPFPFSSRRELLAKHPAPIRTWKLGAGKVDVTTPDDQVSHDTWLVDGYEVLAMYRRGGTIAHFCISLPEPQTDKPLDTDCVHWEAKPADAPAEADLVGMALLVAWATDRFGLPAKHASTELGKRLASRAITPRTFLKQACCGTLTTGDVVPKLGEFLSIYTHNEYSSDEDARKPVDARIKDLLKLKRDDERRYTDDFLGTFQDVVDNVYYVPDGWDAMERIAPVLDARFADFEATRFRSIPDLALYENAAKLRDKHSVTPERAQLAKQAVDDGLAEELVGLIDKRLTDKHVKVVLTKAGLPIGKRIDEQANPAFGVSYMGAKFDIDGKKQLGVDDVCFYGEGYETYIRGLGHGVRFVAYPGLLPFGLRIGDSRETVRAKVGTDMKVQDDFDYFETTSRTTSFEFKADKLVKLRIGRPRDR